MADLGTYAGRFTTWRQIISTQPTLDGKVTVFAHFAADVAGYVARGLDKAAAVDELHAAALSQGITDEDFIQTTIADAFTREQYAPHLGEDEAPRPKVNGHGAHGDPRPVAPPIVRPDRATVYIFPDAMGIPPRSCMYGQHYFRGAVTSTVAPGGTGKTTLSLFESITMASTGLRVWYISGEDSRVEIDRRIAAHCQHHNVDQLTVAGNLFVDDKQSYPLRFTTPGNGRAQITFDIDWIDAFAHAVEFDRIDVVIIDPLIGFLGGASENDNQVMDALVKLIADKICIPLNCCLEMSHHVRKPSLAQAEITVDDARGGGALVNATRSCRVINRMTSELAERAGVDKDKRTSYLRLDPGKRNMAPAEAASWWHLVSVLIGNQVDNVQAIERWTYPSALDGVLIEDLDYIVDLLAKPGTSYRASSKSPEWLGVALAKRLKMDLTTDGDDHDRVADPKKDCPRLNKILGTWVKTGAIGIVARYDAKARKEFKFYVPPSVAAAASEVPGSQDDDDYQEELGL